MFGIPEEPSISPGRGEIKPPAGRASRVGSKGSFPWYIPALNQKVWVALTELWSREGKYDINRKHMRPDTSAAVNMGLYLHSPRGNKAQIQGQGEAQKYGIPQSPGTCLDRQLQTQGRSEITPTTSSNK